MCRLEIRARGIQIPVCSRRTRCESTCLEPSPVSSLGPRRIHLLGPQGPCTWYQIFPPVPLFTSVSRGLVSGSVPDSPLDTPSLPTKTVSFFSPPPSCLFRRDLYSEGGRKVTGVVFSSPLRIQSLRPLGRTIFTSGVESLPSRTKEVLIVEERNLWSWLPNPLLCIQLLFSIVEC